MVDAVKPLFNDDEDDLQEEEKSPYTTWHNPTDTDVVLDLHVATPTPHAGTGPGGAPRERKKHGQLNEKTGTKRFIIKARGECIIPAEFDQAIQKVTDGIIQCGLAPQLINRGVKILPKLHVALDVAEQKRKETVEAMRKAVLDRAAAAEELATSQAQLAQLREEKRKTDDERAKLEADAAAPAPAPKPAPAAKKAAAPTAPTTPG